MMQPEIEIAELLADLEEAAAAPLNGAAASCSDSDDSDVPIIPADDAGVLPTRMEIAKAAPRCLVARDTGFFFCIRMRSLLN